MSFVTLQDISYRIYIDVFVIQRLGGQEFQTRDPPFNYKMSSGSISKNFSFKFREARNVFHRGPKIFKKILYPYSRDSADLIFVSDLMWIWTALLERAALWVLVAAMGLRITVGLFI
jgi:hypothetical protein